MDYFVEGTCWSKVEGESHLKENCVDMTYSVFDNHKKQLPLGFFETREQAEQALLYFLQAASK